MVSDNYLYPHHPQMPQPPLTNTEIHDPQPQPHLHPQPYPQPPPHTQGYPQPQPQPHPQPQALPQLHFQPHPQPQTQLQLRHPFIQPVMGQLHLQSQPHQQMPPVTPYHPLHLQPRYQGSSPGMGHPVQVESQFPLRQTSQTSYPLHSYVPLQHQQMVLLPTTGQHPHIPPVQQSLSIHHAGQQIHHQPGILLPLQRPLLQKLSQQDAHSAVHQSQLLPLQRPLLQKFPQQHAHSAVHQSHLFSGPTPGLVHDREHQQRPLASVQPSQPHKSLGSLPFHDSLGKNTGPWHVAEFGHLRLEKMSPGLPSSGLGSSSAGPGLGGQMHCMQASEVQFGGGFLKNVSQGSFQGDMEPFDHSRKRKPGSMEWCRICNVDCKTVGGIELHSQTKEHQRMEMEMEMARSIERDSAKKHKLSSQEHTSHEVDLRLEKMSPGLPSSGLGSSSARPGLGRQMRCMQMSDVQFGGGFQMHVSQGSFQGDMERFDHSRKRKPGSMEWCHICNVDCKTVEGIERHSLTKEHQKMEMAMEMARSIERDSAKKQKLSSQEHTSHEGANKAKKVGHRRRS